MQFLGPTTKLDGRWVRPHDLVLHHDDTFGGRSALVERITHLGFEVRVDLTLDRRDSCWAQLSRGAAAELHLAPGDEVWVSQSEVIPVVASLPSVELSAG